MYGTIARIKAKPEILDAMNEYETRRPPGFIRTMVFQMDSDPSEFRMVVLFKDKESYHANANSPEQAKEYEQLSAMFLEEPVWHDGTVVFDSE